MGRGAGTAMVASVLATFIFIFISLIPQPAVATKHYRSKRHYLHWTVETKNVTRDCETVAIAIVNGQFPGPSVHVNEGDTLIINVTSKVDTDVTLHWHGIKQMLTNWADGPTHITQCPLSCGESYTYEFTVANQSGTYFWHAHAHWLRATVYGAFIVHSKAALPYSKPTAEKSILFGEWYPKDPNVVESNALAGHGANFQVYTSYTLNGWPGPLYNCSKGYAKLKFVAGKTYLLRLVNAALNNHHFFMIANHTMTVVAADGEYVKPFTVTAALLSPGQTMDVLVTADQPKGKYYFGISEWRPLSLAMDTSPSTPSVGILEYSSIPSASSSSSSSAAKSSINMPTFPPLNDSTLAHNFSNSLFGLIGSNLPRTTDRSFVFAAAVANVVCTAAENCTTGTKIATTLNNVTFDIPTNSSILEAYYYKKKGVYTTDFPPNPPEILNFTSSSTVPQYNVTSHRGAKTLTLKYNQTVQVILQDVDVYLLDYHPFHLHGHSFHVVGSGFGNYNATTDPKNFNLVDPPMRNTVGLPDGGWVAIRFLANNPGVWNFHCHIERHMSWGMMMAFITENGEGPTATLPAPKHRLPQCKYDPNP